MAAAMPVRVLTPASTIEAVSLLDIVIAAMAVTLVVDCASRPLNVGYPWLFALLCIPALVCALSMLWTQSRLTTMRATASYVEGLIAYLFVVRELEGVSPSRVMVYVKRYAYLVTIPAVLLLLHVPGFAPQDLDPDADSGGNLTYYSRLSHPVLGRSNNLATVLAFFIPLLFYWGHVHRDRRFTRAGFVLLIAVAFTQSRGVILALVITALIAAAGSVLRRRSIDSRTLGKIAAAGAATATGVVLLHSFNPYTREFFKNRFSPTNLFLREDLVDAAMDKLPARPFLGYGGGVVPDQDPELLLGVHNTYLQQMLSFGPVLGVLVSVSLIGTAVFFFSRRQTRTVSRVIGLTLLAQLLIFFAESSFEGAVLRTLFYLSIGLVTALARSCEAFEARTGHQPSERLPDAAERTVSAANRNVSRSS
ncbi:O-antigen ligase family protein [Streptomyces sp. HUAS ZL42]|uniref:O-antigen ligase family protein n=1 Tax=Streptomyces sp. HUAS ZL42 TaxID=3231715 RepID=UPI00345E4D2C